MSRRRPPALYRLLLRLYPRDFRARLGTSMAETFADELRAARMRGAGAVVGLWLRALLRTPLLAAEERVRSGRTGGARGASFVESSWSDLRLGVRALVRTPGFVAVTVLTVGLGVGATASLFSVANALLLRPLPVQDPDRLVRVQELRSRTLSSGMEGPRLPHERVRAFGDGTGRVFSGVAGHNLRDVSMRVDGPAFPATAVLVTANYFEVLGIRPALGRFFAAEDEPSAVLGHRLWQQEFGSSADVIGRSVHVNGRAFTVTGVAPRGFGGTIGYLFADVWVPHGAHGGDAWPAARLSPFARLRPGVGVEAATEIAGAVTRRLPPDDDPTAEVHGVRLEPMTATPASMAGPVRGFLALLLATALLVLLIAGANVAGMLLARAVSRRRDLAVRLALGVGRGRLIRQLMIEAVALFVAGGIAGVLVATWATRIITRVRLPMAQHLVVDASPDLRVLAFALGIAIVTGALFGLLPAVHAARSDVAGMLRDGGRGASRGGTRIRDVFVMAQLAMSVLLLVVAALFVRSLQSSLALDFGFDPDGVVVAATNLEPHGYDAERGRAFYARYLEGVRALPAVESAALAEIALLTGESSVFSGWRLQLEGDELGAGQNVVDEHYFETLRVDLVAGRGIDSRDVAGAPGAVVVNEAFARRMWPGLDPVGRTVLRGSAPHQVVGVVRDGAYVEFGEAMQPFAFLAAAQRYSPRQVLHARLRPGASVAEVLHDLRTQVAALDADVAVEQAMPLSSAIAVLLFPQRFAAVVIGLFGLLGLFVAAIGVYGVLAHHVAQRTREFGIRIALGADAGRLLRMVLRRGAVLAVAGCAVGLVIAALVTRFIRGFLHGVDPLDAAAFAGVPLLLCAVALLASSLPARRALRADPIAALRRE